MKKLFPLFFVLLLISVSCLNKRQIPEGIAIQMHSPDLADSSTVYITGSISQLGNWNPAAIKMSSIEDHTWRYCIPGEVPNLIEYKFTLGSWDKEAAGVNGLPLQNFVLNNSHDTLVKHEINFWLNGRQKIFKGGITGSVKYIKQLKGDGILDRDVVIWLPPDYESNLTKHYPVLYMSDGQNLFDPATSSFGVDWQIDETLDSMAHLGIIEIPIVVGIFNTPEHTADYTPGKQSKKYMQFVVETLKPLIDQDFRTLPDRENTAIGGSSYGGLVSFMLAWEYPQVFSKAFCLSPAFKIQNIDYVKNVLNYKGKHKNLTFYIDNGGVGLEEQLRPGIDQMIKALEIQGYVLNKDVFLILDKDARHFESNWAKRMPMAFQLMYSKK